MIKRFSFFLLFVMLSSGVSAATENPEISHFLRFVENSQCLFIRNGTEYTSLEAHEHIEKKYEYVRRHVETTEDFIKYAAAKSSLSGRSYSVICDGSEQATALWLLDELSNYRARADEAI